MISDARCGSGPAFCLSEHDRIVTKCLPDLTLINGVRVKFINLEKCKLVSALSTLSTRYQHRNLHPERLADSAKSLNGGRLLVQLKEADVVAGNARFEGKVFLG